MDSVRLTALLIALGGLLVAAWAVSSLIGNAWPFLAVGLLITAFGLAGLSA